MYLLRLHSIIHDKYILASFKKINPGTHYIYIIKDNKVQQWNKIDLSSGNKGQSNTL